MSRKCSSPRANRHHHHLDPISATSRRPVGNRNCRPGCHWRARNRLGRRADDLSATTGSAGMTTPIPSTANCCSSFTARALPISAPSPSSISTNMVAGSIWRPRLPPRFFPFDLFETRRLVGALRRHHRVDRNVENWPSPVRPGRRIDRAHPACDLPALLRPYVHQCQRRAVRRRHGRAAARHGSRVRRISATERTNSRVDRRWSGTCLRFAYPCGHRCALCARRLAPHCGG